MTNWPRGMKLCTDVDKDIIIPFLTCAKASGHLQWHTGQFIVDTGQISKYEIRKAKPSNVPNFTLLENVACSIPNSLGWYSLTFLFLE